jgi:hypothetical protein
MGCAGSKSGVVVADRLGIPDPPSRTPLPEQAGAPEPNTPSVVPVLTNGPDIATLTQQNQEMRLLSQAAVADATAQQLAPSATTGGVAPYNSSAARAGDGGVDVGRGGEEGSPERSLARTATRTVLSRSLSIAPYSVEDGVRVQRTRCTQDGDPRFLTSGTMDPGPMHPALTCATVGPAGPRSMFPETRCPPDPSLATVM